MGDEDLSGIEGQAGLADDTDGQDAVWRWVVERRLLFWLAVIVGALLFTPDPTGVLPLLIIAVLIPAFEVTLFVLRWQDI